MGMRFPGWLDRADWTVRRQPDRIAVIDIGRPERRLTYGDLSAGAAIVHRRLAAAGLGPGTVFTYQLPNHWLFPLVTLAVWEGGGVVAPALPSLGAREMAQILDATGSPFWLTPRRWRGRTFDAFAPETAAAAPGRPLWVPLDLNMEPETLDAALANAPSRRPSVDPSPDLPEGAAQLLFTSGTTGEPKGVVHTHQSLAQALAIHVEGLDLGSDEVVFVPSPLAHQTGFLYGLLLGWHLGATVVLQDGWDPSRAAAAIAGYGVSFTQAAWPFLVDLAARDGGPPLPRFVVTGAGVPELSYRALKNTWPGWLTRAWGSTETGLVLCHRPGRIDPDDWASEGPPLPSTDAEIRDETGNPVPPGRSGRLWVRTPAMFAAYWRHPEWYQNALDPAGYFDTGDLAVARADGSIRLEGRVRDVINRGGEKIPVVEVESLLHEHPAVREVAVVAAPDFRLGERAVAVVVPRDPASPPDLKSLARFLEAQGMAKIYWPEGVLVLSELPRTASGKVQKATIRDRVREIFADRVAPSPLGG